MNSRNTSPSRRTRGWMRAGLFSAALALAGASQAQVDLTATAGVPAASYSTLKEAFDAVNAGTHQGDINIDISGNTLETATAVLNNSGAGSALYTSVSIQPTGGPRVIEGTVTGAIIRLNGADNVTIDGRIGGVGRNLTVRNNSTASATAAVWLSSVTAGNGCTNNVIRNLEIACGVTQNTSTLSTFGIIMSGTAISTTSNGVDNDNNTFRDNRVIRARYGITTRGTTTNLNENIQVLDNIVGPTTFGPDQIGKVGIFMQADNNSTVSGNLVQFVGGTFGTTTSGADRYGIAIGNESWSMTPGTITSTNYTVSRNIVHSIVDERTFSAVGIGLQTTNGGSPTNNVVCSNFIYNVLSNGTAGDQAVGLGIAGGWGDQVVHNSISMSGDVDFSPSATATTNFGSGIRIGLDNGTTHNNLTLKNNIVYMDLSSSSTPTARYYAISGRSAAYSFGTGGQDHNCYYINPLNPQVQTGGLGTASGVTLTTQFATLANWQTAYTVPQDANSIQADPGFVSGTDLHIQPGATAVNNVGTPIAACAVDIDSDPRDPGTPDIGADEYSPLVCAGAAGGTISPSTQTICAGQTATMVSVGAEVGVGVSYQWEVSTVGGGIGFADVTGGSGATTDSYTTGTLTTGTYYYRLRVECSNGPVTGYSNELVVTVDPTPTASATNDGPVCAGGTLNLDGTTDIGTSFSWSGPDGFSSGVEDPSIAGILLAQAGTYTFTATLGNCTSDPATTAVVVNVAPTIQSLTATPNPVCVNNNSQLNVTALVDVPFVRITEITFFRTGTGQTTPWPATIPTGPDDYVELNNTSGLPADISGWTYADYSSGSATPNHTLTFPAGTVIPPNGFIVIGLATGTNDPANYYYAATGTSNFYSSGGNACFILRDASSVIVDAVATNTATFNVALGVTPADWSGAGASALSGNAGSRRTAAIDSNTGADWTTSSAVGGTQTIGTFNPGYTNTNQAAPSSYLWTPNTYLNADNIADPLATAVSASETYTVTVAAPNGCTTQGVLQLNTTLQITGAAITGDLDYCAGGSTTLTAVPNDGGPPYQYLWFPGGEITASINVTSPGSYYCIVDDACGGSVQTATVNVVENPLPSVAVNPSSADFCVGNPAVQLLASGAVSYSWSPALGLNTTTGANVDATPTLSTVYTVTGTDANGCQNTATASITVLGNAPIITTAATANPNPVCPGSNSQLNVAAQANAGIYAVSSIPYGLIAGAPTNITNWANGGSNSADDGFSPSIPLPFPFLFDGVAVSQLWVGTNGYVTFNVPTAVTGLECRTSANMNTATNPNGVIAMCFADLNVTGGAAIGTFVSGSPGSQVFVINFSALPFFSNTGSVNGQIHLYEGTNRIEVHVTNVDPGTSGSARALGIENQAGSDRVFAPGRTSGTWTVSTPEAWRFEPPQANYSWSPATFLNDPNIADPIAQNVTAATLYTVTVSNNAGCTVTSTVNLAIETTDSDGDGIADCADSCPNLFGQNGDPCDDLDPTTGNDILVNCVCVGQLIDCLGVPGGTDLPGSACDDGNPLTGNDTWDANCACVGIPVDCLGVPGGTDLPGSPCDDNDPTTGNDTWDANCVCVGQLIDCLGVPGGADLPGSPCDDNDPTTGNDTWDGNCNCVGLPLDCVGVPGGTTLPGSPCDDNDPNTINDVYDANCVCTGTPVGGCNDNQVFVTINTDANGSQTSWQIVIANTNSVVCSGSNLLSNATVIGDCCLPDGCYELRVQDSFGDGINPGGYVLTNGANERIIDNTNNGSTFTTLSQAPLGFCLPIGSDQMAAASCDNLNLTPTSVISAQVNAAVSAQYNVTNSTSGYQFWLFNPHGGYSRRVFQAHNVGAGPAGATRCASLALGSLTTLPPPQNTILNVRVRSRVAGVYAEFGPACQMRIFAPACSTTKLVDDPQSSVFSCGVVKKFGPANQTISAFPVFGANRYQFRFVRVGGGYTRNVASNDQNLVLNWSTLPLVNGDTYDVTVRVSFDGGNTYCPFGAVCQVTINNSLPQAGGRDAVAALQGNSDLLMFPNPNRDGLVNLRLTGVPAEVLHVQVDVIDLFGKRVFSTQLAADALVHTTLNLGELASGVYLVNLTGGDHHWNQRLVIQR